MKSSNNNNAESAISVVSNARDLCQLSASYVAIQIIDYLTLNNQHASVEMDTMKISSLIRPAENAIIYAKSALKQAHLNVQKNILDVQNFALNAAWVQNA
jgi:hypothetical protein